MQNGLMKNDNKMQELIQIAKNVRDELWSKKDFDKLVKSIFTGEDVIEKFWVLWKDVGRLIEIWVSGIIEQWLKDKRSVLDYIEQNYDTVSS